MSRKMQISLCSILVLVLAGSAMAQDDPSLVGWWRFDDGGGTVAVDSSGNGNDGVFSGDPVWVPGVVGTALQFDGEDDYVEVPHNDILNPTEELGLALWVNAERYNSAGEGWGGIMGKAGPRSYCLFTVSSGILHFTSSTGTTSADTFPLNEWSHIAVTLKGGVHEYYVNGQSAGTGGSGIVLPAANTNPVMIGNINETNRFFQGMLDDVRLYNRSLSVDELEGIMTGSLPTVAASPSPANGDEDVVRDSLLTWKPNMYESTHNLYFGTDMEDIASGTTPTVALDVNSFDPGRLDFGQTYFWRVDEVNVSADKTVYPGELWSFIAEPYSIQIAGSDIIATASSVSNDFSTPERTLDGSGLGEDDTHSIASEAMWFTAMGDVAPWIQYEFDGVKKLDTMKVWNSNSSAEGFIGYGVKGVEIAYSVDGETWNVLEDANEFSRAPGNTTYNQYDTIDFGGVAATVVRLNIQGNWGGFMQAYSLSEVQFSAIPAAARTPMPASGSVDILPNDTVSWRAGREAAQSTVYVSTDPNEVADGIALSVTSNTNSIDLSLFDLQMGETYYWRVDEVNNAEVESVWAGPVWSFSVVAAVVVDDFESYGNDSPDRPFQAWLDGIGYSADEFFPTAYTGNGTDAAIGHDIWSGASAHYNGDIMETANTMPGSSQSMPFYYDNSGGIASLTERSFAPAQDWTIGGAQTLSIAFSGQTGNTGTLYVKINNTKLTYPRAATNIAQGAWQAWNIDLTSMNVQNVTTLQIGVDGSGASGLILIDDIRLHAEAGQVITPADPGTNGLVAKFTFDGDLSDSSGNGHNGIVVGTDGTTIVNDPIRGQVLSLPGGDDQYVEVAAVGISGTMPRTIACWAKAATTDITDYTLIFGFTGQSDGTGGNGSHFNIGSLGGPGGVGAHCWGWEETMVSDEDALEWHHYTMTYDGTTIAYFADGIEMDSDAAKSNVRDLSTSSDRVHIGSRITSTFSFPGNVDNAVIYDRVLTAGEILSLAEITAPVDKIF